MTTCHKILPWLTAYLDGELADDDGSVVRGHLRECAGCRQVARDEAALRDGLRVLAPVDPPASLWAGVQAQLAAAEVADARKPPWRRAVARLARWAPGTPTLPQLAAAGLVAVAAAVTVSWRAQRADDPAASATVARASRPAPPADPAPGPTPGGAASRAAEPPRISVPAAGDVTADLIAEPARTTASYGQVIEELMKLTTEARAGWADEQKAAFDATLVELRAAIARAAPGHRQQRAQRTLIRYLQRAVVRDDVVLASGGTR